MLNNGLIIWFDGTHAGLPTNFTRETDLDSKYPKGTADATNPGTTGGNANHSHTSPSHFHALDAHTHTFTSGDSDGGTGSTATSSSGVNKSHVHAGTSGAASGGDTDGTAATYASTSNDPPYYEVIFIKAVGSQLIPVNGIVLRQETSRAGLSAHSASAGKYFKGAGVGADAGGTGGSVTNTHSITHTHTTNTHTHASAGTGGASNTDGDVGASSGANAQAHTHLASFGTGTEPIDSYSTPLVTAETVEPAHRTLNSYVNDGAGPVALLPGDIAMWLGTLATIPAGWFLCDGTEGTLDMRDNFLKIPVTPATSTTGGSNTHTHAAQSHTHNSTGGHDHNVTFDTHSTDLKVNVGSGAQDVAQSHSHTAATSTSDNSGYASANTTGDSSDNQPEFRTVAYVQFAFKAGGALHGELV